MRRVLFVSNLLPEVSSSAAGVRTWAIVEACRAWWGGAEVSYLCSSNPSGKIYADKLREELGVPVLHCPPNRSEECRRLLQEVRPHIVFFDRFISEEMFSFHVKDALPHALRVLDMQDMHSWRRKRHRVIAEGGSIAQSFSARPSADQPDYLRELASILRSDLTLVVGNQELLFLRNEAGVPGDKVVLASFLTRKANAAHRSSLPSFENRRHFVSVGNFLHPPNIDSMQWLLGSGLWDRIRAKLPGSEMHIYGAYAPKHFAELCKNKPGFVFKGFLKNLEDLKNYRVLLSPLRFGAGVKGKVLDAWHFGTPVVTTPIGSESLHPGDSWGGSGDCTTVDSLEHAAVGLYSDRDAWKAAQTNGFRLLETLHDRNEQHLHLKAKLDQALKDVTTAHQRGHDHLQALLWHQSFRATEYFSKWLELKETTR